MVVDVLNRTARAFQEITQKAVDCWIGIENQQTPRDHKLLSYNLTEEKAGGMG
jgi:hypothetical protein